MVRTFLVATLLITSLYVIGVLAALVTPGMAAVLLLVGLLVGWLANPHGNEAADFWSRLLANEFDDYELEEPWGIHLKRISDRAKKWTLLGYLTLGVAIAAVVVGIFVFVYAERITARDVDLEALQRERDAIAKGLDANLAAAMSEEWEYDDWNSIKEAWDSFNTPVQIQGYASSESDLKREIEEYTKQARQVRLAIARLHLPGRLDPIDGIEKSNLDRFETMAREQAAMSLADFADALEELLTKAEEVVSRRMLDRASELLTTQINQVGTFHDRYIDVKKEILRKLAQLKNEVPRSQRMLVAKRQQLTSQLAEKDAEIREARKQFDPTNLYSVLPVLAVRVGIVILLIYLTQIFLAMYRYSTQLAGFYSALADAFAVTYPRRPSHDELAKLIIAFNPADAAYTTPTSPVQQVSDLFAGIRGK